MRGYKFSLTLFKLVFVRINCLITITNYCFIVFQRVPATSPYDVHGLVYLQPILMTLQWDLIIQDVLG